MTKQEVLAQLGKDRGDEERDHAEAEKALLAYLNDPEIAAAWEEAKDVQNWWYA